MPIRKNIERARRLRGKQTDVEQLLWYKLRSRQIEDCKFRRQHSIGQFIVDFACLEKKLIIELDGSQHFDATTYDNKRTEYLQSEGFHVLRFWNNDVVNNLDGVLESILLYLGGTPHPNPLPFGERE